MTKKKYGNLEEKFEKIEERIEELKEEADIEKLRKQKEELEELKEEKEKLEKKINEKFQKFVNCLTSQKRISVDRRITVRDDKIRRYGSHYGGGISLSSVIQRIPEIREAVRTGRKEKKKIEDLEKIIPELKNLDMKNIRVVKEIGEGKLICTQYLNLEIDPNNSDSFYNEDIDLNPQRLEDIKRFFKVRNELEKFMEKIKRKYMEKIKEREEVLEKIKSISTKYFVMSEL